MNGLKSRLFFALLFCAMVAMARNVIIMIPDGTGFASLHAARDAKGAPLAIDKSLYGAVQTRSADNSVTDSAAAGTALACGLRTKNGTVGVDPQGQPLENLLEYAHARGMATGVVTTDKIVGATPAAFSAHALARGDAEVLFEQQIASRIDLFMGGGRALLTDDRKARMEAAGFTLVQTREEMLAAPHTPRLFGLFAKEEMTPMLVRKTETTTEPTLLEMATCAIDRLARNEKGFVLMIEGALVDKGNHANDLPYATEELLAFDLTVEYVLDWAKKTGDTLVVILPDHETGGLTILNEPHEGARGEALRAAKKKGLKPSDFHVHYSTTWHSAVDVFLAGNDPSVRILRNEALPMAVMEKPLRRLAPLKGKQFNDATGWPCLEGEDGVIFRAHQEAIYFPQTKRWYQKANN